MRVFAIIVGGACVALIGLSGATQFLAHAFAHQDALGTPAITIGDAPIYAPWSVIAWTETWADAYPKPFAVARLIVFAGFVSALCIVALGLRQRMNLAVFGKDSWAKFADIEAAELFAKEGAILGKFEGEILAFNGPEHQILIGASRSGKGRGHIVPTLLTWNGSALILDVKGELDRGDPRHGFPGTSGFRATLGRVIRFAPTDPNSACFNNLFEVRRGRNEVRDIQNIVDIIVGQRGEAKGAEAFWNETAKVILTGVIIDTLYTEPLERKTFAVVREKLRDLDATAERMRATLHRLNPKTGEPEVHPEVRHAAESYLAGEERLRSSIKATVESFFGLFADPLVAEKTARSDFRIGDLMCADRPVTLYLQPPPGDAARLMPLIRLFIAQVARSLMEHQTEDACGRLKRHRLLMLLDEFPQLGRIDFFEKMMGTAASYGIKLSIACQSLNHITRAYGRDSVIIDNCHVVTAFAAADPETAERIASMAGEVWEIRPTMSEQRPRALFGMRKGAITYREERRPLMLPADVRKLPRDEQLIFVSGAKPIRAKKLRFDAERIFAKRLMPPAPIAHGLSATHDWTNVVALGRAPAPRRPLGAKAERSARPAPRAVAAPAPAPQADLFAQTPAPEAPIDAAATAQAPMKISEQALAGFRGSPSVPPPNTGAGVEAAAEGEVADAANAPEGAPPRRRIRAEGV